MEYKCIKCRQMFAADDNRIRCPFCGFRILSKPRPPFKKRIRAR